MRADTLSAIAGEAWRKGAGEAQIPGVGFVRIVRVESRGARYGDYVREFYLDSVKTTGAAVWRRVRELDREVQPTPAEAVRVKGAEFEVIE